MKKADKEFFRNALLALVVIAAGMIIFACTSQPAVPKVEPLTPPATTIKVYPPQIIEHKGTAFGRNYPDWLPAALDGPKIVEKLPDYSGKYVIVATEDGQDLAGAQLAAAHLNAQANISAIISTRVKDTFAGAQVGDKDKIEAYMERAIKTVSESSFSGFAMEGEWWVRLQTFDEKGKLDTRIYRVVQLWTIDKDILQTQIQKMLSDSANAEPKTPEKERAIDLVQKTFFEDF